ncbi:MAG TPA: energy transducer TonB [Candidatus Dormibacteraeota bacterium]|nr:energy transducer TonB [Candidatus Dormibacteraeota bacterium]
MFADSLLETSWAHRSRRSWTTLTSFGLQAVIIGLLLLVPLLTTVGLPSTRVVSTPISMGHRDPGPAPQTHVAHRGVISIVPVTGRIMAPTRIPTRIPNGDDGVPQPSGPVGDTANCLNCVDLPVGSGPNFPIPFSGERAVPTPGPPPPTRTFRTSIMLQGSLIRRVEPVYPQLAKGARIQGPVELAAVISKAGTIEDLRVISGHPMLVKAALDAVSQWRYRPYILNGDVIEVDTRITVNFVLGGQ